jgi:hypothetical protein
MDPRDDAPTPELPALTRDLKAAYARPVPVPRDVEAAILAMPPRPARRWRLGAGVAAAAAAAVALAVVMVYRPHARGGLRGDVDGSGRVDILDALVLAKSLDAGTPASFDLTGDGRTDSRDVAAIAQSAVSLGGAS